MTTTSASISQVARTVSASQTVQIGAGCRLLQHRHRGATKPGRLRQRRDVSGIGGQYGDRTAGGLSPARPDHRPSVSPRSWTRRQVNRTGSANVPAVRCRGDEAAAEYFAGEDAHGSRFLCPAALPWRHARRWPPMPVPANGTGSGHRGKAEPVEAAPNTTTRRPPCPAATSGSSRPRRCAADTEAVARPSAEMGLARSADRHGRWASAVQASQDGSGLPSGARHSVRGGRPARDRRAGADPARAPVGVGRGRTRR